MTTEYERAGGPSTTVYIVMGDTSESIMVFSDELEAENHAQRYGGDLLPSEPVFDTSAHCAEWCGLDKWDEEANR